ncbi:hypothetical protein DL766_008416 [Monosporascus sp. MC13-8B]|uniref:Uncharacterized protein n=1 Tax=Monosporascus cannonballus TaxID=155416 RepID=A0ABY0GXM2_9PEZI|nr:hypothetical protein DL762_008046 [Monosporascus cannonballus]RYO84466.1 hypothetical protein DL763_007451 [Monosporascus cannonballus]RYP19593.1 hypothetical protein DL766_008416 [Monosporascus sp. MC13-8B]
METSFTFESLPKVELTFSPDSPAKSQEIQPPIAKSFSFAVPDVWRPTKPSVLRWLYDVPIPAHRDESLATASVRGEKHSLDHEISEQVRDDEDHHRHKRNKLRASWGSHPGLERRRQRIIQSSQGIVRRISDVCQRVTTPSRGRYYRDRFDQEWVPTKYELFSKTAVFNGQEVDLEMWDTSGNIQLHQLQLLSYLTWDAVFLCFSLTSQKGFNNAKTKWLDEIRAWCRDAPIILVGLKKDERSISPGLWTPFYRGARITAGEASMAANSMGAVKYMECSAKTGEGVQHIFEESVRIVFDERAADEEAARLKEKSQGTRLSQILCFS